MANMIPKIFRSKEKKKEEPVATSQLERTETESVETEERIKEDDIRNAIDTLEKYKKGKANLDTRIIENEEWWRLRHWRLREKKDEKPDPVSAWLHNSISNKHADMMDNYPEPTVLPREESDRDTAKLLTSILPVVLEYNDYERAYSEMAWDKIQSGTSVKKIVWNNEKNNGAGDVDIQEVDILNLYWQPGISHIQKSRNVFHIELVDNEVLKMQYPEILKDLGGGYTEKKEYIYEDTVDTSEKSAVVDWYYKKKGEDGRTVLHYCKFVNEHILYASENDPEYRERGFYDHGKYPFVFDVMFRMKGTPAGFGYIDIMKDPQMYVDRLNKVMLENAEVSAKKRYFIRNDGGVNEDEFADMSKSFVHVEGNLDDSHIREIKNDSMPGTSLSILEHKIDEIKETSGNRDFSQGSTQSGVTAASAIAALQEAGSKLSRDMIKGTYRAFKEECELVIELMRQFYDEPRSFRITGKNGEEQFVDFDNMTMKEMPQQDMGIDLGARLPVFDVSVSIAKKSTYSRMAQNELAIQFYGLGFFNPQQADQTLACLDMMDFEGKEKIIQRVEQNGTMAQQIMMLQQQVAQLSQMLGIQGQQGLQVPGGQTVGVQEGNGLQYDSTGGASKEHSNTKSAKERVQEAATPQ